MKNFRVYLYRDMIAEMKVNFVLSYMRDIQ
jgi:hypothetical protein